MEVIKNWALKVYNCKEAVQSVNKNRMQSWTDHILTENSATYKILHWEIFIIFVTYMLILKYHGTL